MDVTDNKMDLTLTPTYQFVLESFLDKLASGDLLHRQKLRQEIMLSNISHSIRTPLNGILHMCNAIMTGRNSNDSTEKDSTEKDSTEKNSTEKNSTEKDKMLPNNKLESTIEKPITEQLEFLNQSAVALATNIFDIVDLTKLELGKLILSKEVFDVRDMVNSVMSLANTLNKSKKITLDYHIEPSVPHYIFSDKKRIKQILINLLENSLHYTQSGEVSLYVDATVVNLAHEDTERENSLIENKHGVYGADFQHSISFAVRDTGLGMDKQTAVDIFKPMELLTNSTKQSGLSLRISSMLAEILGGSLSLINTEIGAGSCFEFNLIVCEEDSPVQQTKSIKDLKGKTILLIDDTSERIELCKLFEKYNMKYIVASTYDEVLVLHAEKRFDMTIIHSTENLSAFSDIKSQISTGILLGITDEPQQTKNVAFDDVMFVSTDVLDYKARILELLNMPNTPNTLEKCSIMVVEDEQINRIVIEKILRQLGYKKISLAVNGHDALKQFNLVRPDIMLIDIRMPLMSGFELAEKIHLACAVDSNFTSLNSNTVGLNKGISTNLNKVNSTIEPKMLGVTAQMVQESEIKPWFKDFIYKPIDIQELDKKIKSMML
jgi:signal transduction histidine kinase/CheY-like chemotaxis protein